MNILSKAIFAAVAVGVMVAAAGKPATAQNKIVLRVADYLPQNHYIIRYATTYFMDKVREATDGRVQFGQRVPIAYDRCNTRPVRLSVKSP